MEKNIPDVDIILDVLKRTQTAYPESTFINSLLQQYQERGSLSKKQLEGLHSKASKVQSLPPGKLATIQAIILRKPTRYRSTISIPVLSPGPDNSSLLIDEILVKYPGHKRVRFFKMKTDTNDVLTTAEKLELEKFHKLLT